MVDRDLNCEVQILVEKGAGRSKGSHIVISDSSPIHVSVKEEGSPVVISDSESSPIDVSVKEWTDYYNDNTNLPVFHQGIVKYSVQELFSTS